MTIRSQLLTDIPNVAHAFGTRKDPVSTLFLKDWVEQRPSWKQVHGTGIAEVTRVNQECGEADALLTRSSHPIGVVTADCVPILFARKDGGVVAAMHAGWRGTYAGFIRVFAGKLRDQGENPSHYVAVLGPSIQACCYKVGEDLLEKFQSAFPWVARNELNPAPGKLDLHAVNTAELQREGFGKIERIPLCTYCEIQDHGPVFHSYRREGGGTRQWSLIARI